MSSEEPVNPPSQEAGDSKRKRPSKGSGDAKVKIAKPSAEELERNRREERLRPHIERLRSSPPEEFHVELTAVLKRMEADRATRADRRRLLQGALSLLPVGLPGWVVMRHYKVGSDWNRSDIVIGLQDLRQAILEGGKEVSAMGAVLHGALVELVDAATAQKSLESNGYESDDVIRSLVQLHSAVGSVVHQPLQGLAEPPLLPLLRKVSDLFARHSHRHEVRSINGQNLFGFDLVLRMTMAAESLVPAAPETSRSSDFSTAAEGVLASRPTEPIRRVDSAPQAETPQKASEHDALRKKVSSLEARLADAIRKIRETDSDKDRLRREVETAREAERSLRAQLEKAIESREAIAICNGDLQSRIDVAEEAVLRLEQVRELLVQRDARIEDLESELQRAELQARSAKDSEFERGRAAMRATIAAHCVESLRQIAEAAAPMPDDSGKFIREAARALANYFEGKRN